MAWFSITGLLLDLVGVLLLGIDLIRIQRSQIRAAKTNERLIKEAFPEFQYIGSQETFFETGVSGSDGFDGDGGLDARGLSRTLRAFRDEIEKSVDGVTDTLEYLFASVAEQSKEARKSLIFSYIGLVLIVVGFGLQIIGAIPNLLPTAGGS